MSRSAEQLTQLTLRETQVMRLVARGMSAKEAAKELQIAPCTVERHVENVRLKTRTRNRAHMIAFVIGEGLLSDATRERIMSYSAPHEALIEAMGTRGKWTDGTITGTTTFSEAAFNYPVALGASQPPSD